MDYVILHIWKSKKKIVENEKKWLHGHEAQLDAKLTIWNNLLET